MRLLYMCMSSLTTKRPTCLIATPLLGYGWPGYIFGTLVLAGALSWERAYVSGVVLLVRQYRLSSLPVSLEEANKPANLS